MRLEVESITTSEETAMEEGHSHIQNDQETESVLKLAGDAPVEISVEIARFTLTIAELGRLKPGEILLTRRPIGERVTLRAGRHAFASGELVDVDGEVGVRIVSPA
jgi:flagellar motor switch/type III secretory pathway protein FliN